MEQCLKERGLELSQEKTHCTHSEDGFDFLGQHLRKQHGPVLVKPARANGARFLSTVRELIQVNAQATAGNLIHPLNPLIRGWAHYHRHVASQRTFAHVDNAIFLALWGWAKRRHPHKPKRWIQEKYFHAVGGRNWMFSGEVETKDGKSRAVHLFEASKVPIKRHTKIKGEANPYDPAWEIYFETRLGVKRADNLQGQRTLLYLWREQHGLCPLCQQPITKLSGWHNHHIVQRVAGGGEEVENRVLLHPNCHRQVHSQRLKVVKPRPAKGV